MHRAGGNLRRLPDPCKQRSGANLESMFFAACVSMGLNVGARWVLNLWPLQLGRGYLLVCLQPAGPRAGQLSAGQISADSAGR